MTDEPDGEVPGYSLLMPFVVASDNGGPFDATAFTAGFEMGAFGQRCAVAASLNLMPFTITIRRDNVKQADLIAMHQKLALNEEPMSDEIYDEATIAEWANVTIGWPIEDNKEQ